MAFNPLECLEKGNIEILDRMHDCDIPMLIDMIRGNPRKNEIIDGFINRHSELDESFLFNIIYDMERYKDYTKEILYKKSEVLGKTQLSNLLTKTSLGPEYIERKLDQIIEKHNADLDFIFDFILSNSEKCFGIIERLKKYPNTYVRARFIAYIVKNNGTNLIRNDLFDSLIGMSSEEISTIARALLLAGEIELYKKVKDYLFKLFPVNELPGLLVTGPAVSKEEFERDADNYFKAASTYRINMLKNHSSAISIELLTHLRETMEYFKKKGYVDDKLTGTLDSHASITRLIEEYVDKYLELSKSKEHRYIKSGSTASCYQIGDYAFKLLCNKYSREEILCPDLYLILPNLEEYYAKDKDGRIVAGIEVQKFLTRSASGVRKGIFDLYRDELRRFGYYYTDKLIGGEYGDNAGLLDSYLDAGMGENVPGWFKKYPIVLIDHDMIHRIGGDKRGL